MKDEDLAAIRARADWLSEYMRERGYDQVDEGELPLASAILRLIEDITVLAEEVESIRGPLDPSELVVERVRRDLGELVRDNKLDLLRMLDLGED